MENKILIGIIVLCVALLLTAVFRNRLNLVVNFVFRMMIGILAIYITNSFLIERGMETIVGINPITMLTVGFLGIPGFLLVYGVGAYYFLFRY